MVPAPLLWAALAAYGATALIGPTLYHSQLHYGPRATNYAGRPVAAAAGLVLPLGYSAGYIAAAAVPASSLTAIPLPSGSPPVFAPSLLTGMLLMLLLITASALWGLLDDAVGGVGPRGWRGHWQSIAAGPASTGAFKIVGMAAAALVVVCAMGVPLLWTIPAALVPALSANTINMLDLRPGRALKGFWLGALFLLAAAGGLDGPAAPLLPLAAATLAYAPADFAGRVMLGDTGANALGAALGLVTVGLAIGRHPALLLPAVLILAGSQWLGERWSWSAAINSRPLLTRLDNLGRRPAASCREWKSPRE